MIVSPLSIVPTRPSVRLECFICPLIWSHLPTAMLFYDWMLCLDQEVACIWKASGKLNAGSLVYVLCRFAAIMNAVFITASVFPLSFLVSNPFRRYSSTTVYTPTEVTRSILLVSPREMYSRQWRHAVVASSTGWSFLSRCSCVVQSAVRRRIYTI